MITAPVIVSPVGVDIPIKELQSSFANNLPTLWDTLLYYSFGRCYLKKVDAGNIPVIYTGGTHYYDILQDTTIDCHSFFNELPSTITRVNKFLYRSTVDIIFSVNLSKIKASLTHRADEEALKDVVYLIENDSNFEIQTIVKGLDAYSGFFYGNFPVELEPMFLFKLTTQVIYTLETNC
jgi:hypothetical protein